MEFEIVIQNESKIAKQISYHAFLRYNEIQKI